MIKQICNKLLPESKFLENGSNITIVNQIYEKYFKEQVEKNDHSADEEEIKRLLEIRSNQPVNMPTTNHPEDIWIFGYGSLVWKADFPFIDRRRGFITGYQRHFYQHSIDHRGIPTKPGRVVTLLPTHKLEDRVYGMAYRIALKDRDQVLQHLDYREKNGYERCKLTFCQFPESTDIHFDVIMYVATAENDSYAGDVWQLSLIADQIFTSAGPSGPNREYLFHLAKAMRVLFPGVNDAHLYDLEQEVLERIKNIEPAVLENYLKREIERIILKNQNEEIESFSKENEEKSIEMIVKKFESLRAQCEKRGWKEPILAKEYLKQENS